LSVRRRHVVRLLLTALLSSACGASSIAPARLGPFEDGWFTTTPAPARGGEHVTVAYERETWRGPAFELHQRIGDEWRLHYILGARRGRDRAFGEVGDFDADRLPKDFGIPSVLLSYPTPDIVQLPRAIATGDYLLCNSVSPRWSPPQLRTACAPLKVKGRPPQLAPPAR
jgi:hypothetical protein